MVILFACILETYNFFNHFKGVITEPNKSRVCHANSETFTRPIFFILYFKKQQKVNIAREQCCSALMYNYF